MWYSESRSKEIENNRNLKRKGNYFDNFKRTKRILKKRTKDLNRRKMSKIGLLRLKAKLKKKEKQLKIYVLIISISVLSVLLYTIFF